MKTIGVKRYAIIGIVLTSIIALLSNCTGIKKEVLWDFFDEIQREIDPNTILNDFIIKDSEKLERRIHRDLDRSIQNYKDLTGDSGRVMLPEATYTEDPLNLKECHSVECLSLGQPMRLCSSWMVGCSDNLKTVLRP